MGALETLYREHRDWVAALAYRMTGSRADALDVLQETFLWLFRRGAAPRPGVSARSLLYPVVKHKAIDVVRRRRKVVALDGDAALAWSGGVEDGDFARLLADLTPEQREVVSLRFGFDFALAEIAAALDIPVGTVMSRLHYALAALRPRARAAR